MGGVDMGVSYQVLYDLLAQKGCEQPTEFHEVINLMNYEQKDPAICELVNYLSQKDVQYATYSHV